jgi:hypothetical protein
LYCKYYCVCRLIKDVCIVSITVYVDLPMISYCKYYCVCQLTKVVSIVYNANTLGKSTYTVIFTIQTPLVSLSTQ